MAIDVETEELVPVQFGPSALPKGAKASLATFKRWLKPPGVRGRVLESVMIGGFRYTSKEAIVRFCSGEPATPGTIRVTSSEQRRRTSSALKALSGMGIE